MAFKSVSGLNGSINQSLRRNARRRATNINSDRSIFNSLQRNIASNKSVNKVTSNVPSSGIFNTGMAKMGTALPDSGNFSTIPPRKASSGIFSSHAPLKAGSGDYRVNPTASSGIFESESQHNARIMRGNIDNGVLGSGNFAKNPFGATDSDMARMDMHDAKIQSRRNIADGVLGSGKFTNSPSGKKDISQSDFIKMQQKQANRQQMLEKGKKIGAGVGLGAAGLYATTDLMNRYRSGGNLGRNSQGEKDIVGIPFF